MRQKRTAISTTATRLFLLCASLLLIGGCIGPFYIPEYIKGFPAEKISKIIIDQRVEFLMIDRVLVIKSETWYPPKPVILSPGKHMITYRFYGNADEWRAFSQKAVSEGYSLSADGKFFIKDLNGVRIRKSTASVARYGWNKRGKEISVEAGKEYLLSDFFVEPPVANR